MASLNGLVLSPFGSPSLLPATSSREIRSPGLDSMEQPKLWVQEMPSSGAAHARHSALVPLLGGGFATKGTWSVASSISSSCSSSSSSSPTSSPGPASSATLASFVGLNRRLEPPSSPGTHSRYFPPLVQRPSRPSEEGLDRISPVHVSPSPIKLPWFFPASKPPVVKKDIKAAFFGQPNLCVPSRSPALGLGLASQPLPPPSMVSQNRLLSTSTFVVPLPEVALSRPSSSYSSWSSGSGWSVPGTPLSFPGFSDSSVWSPHAAHAPEWASPREVAASFGLPYKSQVSAPCDNALGLLHTEQDLPGAPFSAYPGPPPGLPPPQGLVAPLSLGPGLPEFNFEEIEKVTAVKLCDPDVCYCDSDDGVVAGPVIRHAPEIVHAGMTFEVTCTLGMGASARVVGAEHDGRRYAVKVIHKGAAAAAGFTRKEYLRELEVFRRIGRAPETHQFLSTLKMSWEDVSQDRILFVMDLYPTDLFSVLADGMPITLRDRQLYCRELISAVSALRDLGIVHGDIKPSNVLIDTHGRAVLSDFGNAGDASVCADGYEFWKRYVPSGTPPYMAPEVAAANVQEKGYYSASADVWSLGLVFLEIFGRYAGAYFNAWTVEDIQREHANLGRKGVDLKKVPLLEMPRCFEILLDSMLQYYEELRPTVEELGEWNARSTSWEISLGAGHDWVPLLESSRAADERNLVNFLSFGSSSAGATPSGQENSADFEYRAPGAFA